jgi:hypothetical protein
MRFDSGHAPSILFALVAVVFVVLVVPTESAIAQSVPYQRAFSQSKATVEKRIKEVPGANSGRLPTVEGFVVPGDRPLDRFQRAYYECVVQVTSTPSGGSMVRVSATITAWYADPSPAKSGYQVLPSNGRVEADFLDRLQESLTGQVPSSNPTTEKNSSPGPSQSHPASPAAPALSAPTRGSGAPIGQSKTGSPFKLGDPLNAGNLPSLATQKAVVDRHTEEEAKEANGLEEILRNQAHPNNLVAVKKKDTAVLASPSEGAKVLFLAAAEDEFEILDVNPNWVHIRISGLSRGWLRRSSVEMLNNEPDRQVAETPATASTPVDAQPFHVENEQVASFPGVWAPLHGKTVRIVSILKASDNAATTGPAAKLSFAKSLFDREYADLTRTSTSIAGVVMIFDSEDGGMVSATLPALRQWKSGSLSDEAFLRRCFFDPPEAFGLTANQ